MMGVFFYFPKCLLAARTRNQFNLHVCLLLATLWFFLINSFSIDHSCLNYNGNDISGDIIRALREIEAMCTNANEKCLQNDFTTLHLMNIMFSEDVSKHETVHQYFNAFAGFSFAYDNFVIICGDSMVNLVTYESVFGAGTLSNHPNGIWTDRDHSWWERYDHFHPCDPARDPNLFGQDKKQRAYAMNRILIYLCPLTLDDPKGRSLEVYKNQILTNELLEYYWLLPAVLFHELLHTDRLRRKLSFRSLHRVILSTKK